MAKRRQSTAPRKTQGSKAKAPGSRRKGGEEPSLRAIQDAIDKAADWLMERRDFFGYLSRRDQGRGAPELARHLRGDLLARQGADGSWGEGDLAASAEAIWTLLDLGLTPDLPSVTRGIDWLYGQRDQDGSYGAGCTPARHEQGICEHFVSGFFSPGPADEPQEIGLANGQSVTSDVGARLLASERALRSVLRANPHDPRSAASISGLRGLPLYLDYGGSFTPAVLVGAIQALAWARGVGLTELEAGLESLAANQAPDGTWPNVEFFFAIEALLEVKHAAASAMLKRAVPRLLETQLKYGAWGRRHQAAQSSIALRALERVFAESGGRK